MSPLHAISDRNLIRTGRNLPYTFGLVSSSCSRIIFLHSFELISSSHLGLCGKATAVPASELSGCSQSSLPIKEYPVSGDKVRS